MGRPAVPETSPSSPKPVTVPPGAQATNAWQLWAAAGWSFFTRSTNSLAASAVLALPTVATNLLFLIVLSAVAVPLGTG